MEGVKSGRLGLEELDQLLCMLQKARPISFSQAAQGLCGRAHLILIIVCSLRKISIASVSEERLKLPAPALDEVELIYGLPGWIRGEDRDRILNRAFDGIDDVPGKGTARSQADADGAGKRDPYEQRRNQHPGRSRSQSKGPRYMQREADSTCEATDPCLPLRQP
jgi:hypothetical protein